MSRMPQVTARELVRFLRAQGFVDDRQSGSHLTLWHEGRGAPVTFPVHTGCDVGCGLAVRILRDAGFTVDDYLRPPINQLDSTRKPSQRSDRPSGGISPR